VDITEKNGLVETTKTSMVECLVNFCESSRISDTRTRFYITRTFDRFNYKDLVNIFLLNL